MAGKYPFEGFHGQRLLKTEVDFFLENEENTVVLLFAHFAEGMKKWRQQAQQAAPQLGWLRVLARKAYPDKPVQCWVVFPLEGQAVEVRF